MITMREKVRGMLLGVAIGDALGMPVETWDAKKIKDKYPDGVRDYKVPDGHKWYNGQPAGLWTDDTQLTIATVRGIMDAKGFDLDAQGKAAVVAMKDAMKGVTNPVGSGVPGWGYTTVRAVRNLANNVPWSEAGKTTDSRLGHGNGVVMRQSPIAAWFITRTVYPKNFNQKLLDFSATTHYTQQSAIASLVHNHVLSGCYVMGDVSVDYLAKIFDHCREIADTLDYSQLVTTNIDMWAQFDKVLESEGWDAEKIIAEFGGGSCNVGHSLPFSYAFWVNKHDDIQVLYDVIEAGGDTDTNGSIVGSMLGALHGEAIFPEHLVNGLLGKDEILELANDFCDNLGLRG